MGLRWVKAKMAKATEYLGMNFMPPRSVSPEPRVLVWDAPVRVFHWLLALSFAGAYLSAEADGWRWLHISLGYTVAALLPHLRAVERIAA